MFSGVKDPNRDPETELIWFAITRTAAAPIWGAEDRVVVIQDTISIRPLGLSHSVAPLPSSRGLLQEMLVEGIPHWQAAEWAHCQRVEIQIGEWTTILETPQLDQLRAILNAISPEVWSNGGRAASIEAGNGENLT